MIPEHTLNIGIVIGILIALIMHLVREILVREYHSWRNEILRRKSVQEDLRAYLESFRTSWENYKTIPSIQKECRRDLECQIKELMGFYTASAKDLHPITKMKLRQFCSEFIDLLKSTSGIKDQHWFNVVEEKADQIFQRWMLVLK